jgi:diaminopimelate epimerase
MKIPFVKYHGTGNDFILIDETAQQFETLTEEKINRMCDRHFGIGADGLIRLRKSGSADFEMIYYNADGKPGSMCGNGGRCTVAYASALKLAGSQTSFLATDGIHQAEILSEFPFIVRLKMGDVEKVERMGNDFFVNTGSPHFIRISAYLSKIDVYQDGKRIRDQSEFAPGGTNVNFVSVKDNTVLIRTYERGVENETLSCGTGIVASVLALTDAGLLDGTSPAIVKAVGGELKVYFQRSGSAFTDIWLEGGTEAVFSGIY